MGYSMEEGGGGEGDKRVKEKKIGKCSYSS